MLKSNIKTYKKNISVDCSLLRRETTRPGSQPETELYRFGADGNLRLYSYDRLFYSLYGYDAGTTRTYKYSMDLSPNWVNGQLLDVQFNPHNAMFYPNSYLNFNQDGYYTKHYYNGMERIASRLGDQNLSINVNDPELQDRKDWQDSLIRKQISDISGYQFLEPGQEPDPNDPKPIYDLPQIGLNNLVPNTSSIYYYHSNHLGSTCYVTDENASVVQGFLYAPFGEITNEYSPMWQNGNIPKYAFNAKELDEETGMYYYEARYMAPPVFISRDPLFEKYPTFSPYTYCANNPVKFIDPTGKEIYACDEHSANKIMEYLNEHFNDTKAFKFENGYLQIRRYHFNKLYRNATADQKILLSGLEEVIKKDKVALVKVQDNNNNFYISFSNNENFFWQRMKSNSGQTSETPMEGTTSVYAVAINDQGDGKGSQLTTDHFDENGKPLKTTAVASTTFFHEILDEFLSTIINKTVTPESPNKEKVYYQNAALRNLGLLERNGDDHDY